MLGYVDFSEHAVLLALTLHVTAWPLGPTRCPVHTDQRSASVIRPRQTGDEFEFPAQFQKLDAQRMCPPVQCHHPGVTAGLWISAVVKKLHHQPAIHEQACLVISIEIEPIRALRFNVELPLECHGKVESGTHHIRKSRQSQIQVTGCETAFDRGGQQGQVREGIVPFPVLIDVKHAVGQILEGPLRGEIPVPVLGSIEHKIRIAQSSQRVDSITIHPHLATLLAGKHKRVFIRPHKIRRKHITRHSGDPEGLSGLLSLPREDNRLQCLAIDHEILRKERRSPAHLTGCPFNERTGKHIAIVPAQECLLALGRCE